MKSSLTFLLLMAFHAVCLVFYIKGAFSVVADAAELPFVQFFHIDFIGLFGHLKCMIMTGAAFGSPYVDMLLVAEKNWLGALGFE